MTTGVRDIRVVADPTTFAPILVAKIAIDLSPHELEFRVHEFDVDLAIQTIDTVCEQAKIALLAKVQELELYTEERKAI